MLVFQTFFSDTRSCVPTLKHNTYIKTAIGSFEPMAIILTNLQLRNIRFLIMLTLGKIQINLFCSRLLAEFLIVAKHTTRIRDEQVMHLKY